MTTSPTLMGRKTTPKHWLFAGPFPAAPAGIDVLSPVTEKGSSSRATVRPEGSGKRSTVIAPVRAALRRAQLMDPAESLTLGPLHIDVLGHRVTAGEDEIGLTPTEFRLLVELARRPGQVFTRELLLERVWGYDYLGDSRLVDVAVQRLRSKIEADAESPRLIETVRGVGYRAGR